MMRVATAALIAGIVIACDVAVSPTGPTVCDLDAAFDDGHAAGVASVERPECPPTHRYENGRRDVLVDGERFHHEDACVLHEHVPTCDDCEPAGDDEHREWACDRLLRAAVDVPGPSFRDAIASVDGFTTLADGTTESYHYRRSGGGDSTLTAAEAEPGEWRRRVLEAAERALGCR